ncbi:phosphotransferase [Spongiimicrobium salis]|uniref:phosphotransferase n=1 Tax=Spongiimicrobium salis TaxID=1667022 RepID=UPI00374D9688
MSVLPVSSSTLSATHLTIFLQKKYALSGATTCALLRTGMNDLYKVTDGSAKFVFRVYTRDWRTKTEILEELRLLIHLKENKIPVSYPIEAIQGYFIQELKAPEGLRYAVLFSFAEGEKIPHFTVQASYHAGKVMGSMHHMIRNFSLKRVNYDRETLFVQSLKRIKTVFKTPSPSLVFIERMGVYLTSWHSTIPKDSIPTGAIHFDIWFDNMHFTPDDGLVLFDFDFCGNGWLSYDVSYFLYQLFHTHPEVTDYEQKASAFLKGYGEHHQLSNEEMALLPKACLSMMLFYIGVQCYRFDWSNIFLNDHHLQRMCGIMKKWMRYHKIVLPEN